MHLPRQTQTFRNLRQFPPIRYDSNSPMNEYIQLCCKLSKPTLHRIFLLLNDTMNVMSIRAYVMRRDTKA